MHTKEVAGYSREPWLPVCHVQVLEPQMDLQTVHLRLSGTVAYRYLEGKQTIAGESSQRRYSKGLQLRASFAR